MEASGDQQSDPMRGDSRLREFLRRAEPILATERGWNERSRLKLKSLAEDLNLPAPLYESAIERLQQGEVGWDKYLSLYEKKFVSYLKTRLARSKHKVITAAHEKKAVRIARREFQISRQRARQLVRKVSEEMGMSRVSQLDAISHVVEVIAQTIGTSTTVSDDMRERIVAAGKRWGIDEQRVGSLINATVAKNQASYTPKKRFLLQSAATTLAILCMGLVAYFAYSIANSSGVDTYVEPSIGAVDNPVADSIKSRFTPPPWWSQKTRNVFDVARPILESNGVSFLDLVDMSPQRRSEAFEPLIEMYVTADQEAQRTISPLIAQLIYDDLQGQDSLAQLVARPMELPVDRLPDDGQAYHNAFAANQLLNEIYLSSGDKMLRSRLNRLAVQKTGVSLTDHELDYLNQSQPALAERHWQHLSSVLYRQPHQAAKLVAPLSHATRHWLPSYLDVELSTIAAILRYKPSTWHALKQPLSQLVGEASNEQLFEIFQQSEIANSAELSNWLTKEIAQRLGIDTDNVGTNRLANSVRQQIAPRRRHEELLRTRRQRLWRIVPNGQLDFTLADGQVEPQQIADVTFYATLACLLNRAEATRDSAIIDLFDQWSRDKPPNVTVRTASSDASPANLPVYGQVQRRPLPSDQRAHQDSLEKLRNFADHNPQVRAMALERLADSATRFGDMNVADAAMVAKYLLLADHETSEIVSIEKHAAKLSHWANLSIAIADEISDVNVSFDQAVTIAQLVGGITIPHNSRADWRLWLQTAILDRVAVGLAQAAELQGQDTEFQWNELQSYYLKAFHIRCLAYGIEIDVLDDATMPAEFVARLVQHLSDRGRDWSRRQQTVEILAENDIEALVLHGQMLVAQLARASENANRNMVRPLHDIQTNYHTRNRTSQSITQQILLNEIALFKIWSITPPE